MSNRDVDSPFRKRVLLPLWLIRDAVMCLNLVVYILVIAAVSYVDRKGSSDSLGADFDEIRREGLVGTVIAAAAVCMVIIAFCLSLDIACIVKRYRHTLTPKFFLVSNSIQSIIWTVLFVISMIGAGTRNVLSIVLAIAIYLTFLGMLVYAIRVYRRSKREAQLFGDMHAAGHQQSAPVGYHGYQPPKAAHVV